MLPVVAGLLALLVTIYVTPHLLEAVAVRLARKQDLHRRARLPPLQPCTVLCRSFLVLQQRSSYAFAVALVGWAPRNGSCKSLVTGSPST